LTKHLAYHRLREQMARPGCAICHLGAEAAARYLETLCAECVTDPEVRSRLRASLGFCGRHAHQLEAMPQRLAIAILYQSFLQRIDDELENWTRPRRRQDPRSPCPVCVSIQEAEGHYLRVMTAFIMDTEMATAYDRSTGLCLDHMIALCRHLDEPARRRVLAAERARLQELGAELAEVIRKHDYRFQDEPWGEEQTAPCRAVAKVTGDQPAREPERQARAKPRGRPP
jgi:hypothetical protein